MQTFSYKGFLLLISTDEVCSPQTFNGTPGWLSPLPFSLFPIPRQPCLIPACQTTNQLRPPQALFQTRAIPHPPEPALAPRRDPQRVRQTQPA